MAHITYKQLIDDVAIASSVPRGTVTAVLTNAAARINYLIPRAGIIKFMGFGTLEWILRPRRLTVLRGDVEPTLIQARYIARFVPAENWKKDLNPP